MNKLPTYINIHTKYILVTLIISILVGFGVYYYKPTQTYTTIPFSTKILNTHSISCEAILSSYIWGANTIREEGKIKASVSKGTDKIAIEMDDDRLYFLSSASQQTGTARGVEWNIVKNTDKKTVAILFNSENTFPNYNLFILNKETGIAIWTKSREDYIASDNPDTQSYYLICR